jgi:hypothetical protein
MGRSTPIAATAITMAMTVIAPTPISAASFIAAVRRTARHHPPPQASCKSCDRQNDDKHANDGSNCGQTALPERFQPY